MYRTPSCFMFVGSHKKLAHDVIPEYINLHIYRRKFLLLLVCLTDSPS